MSHIPVPMEGFNNGVYLNFKIVGSTTEPTNPKENMIWINTDQKITEWIFSHEQPTDAEEGTVWIQTTTSLNSSVQVDVLKTKKKKITLYPLAAAQYIEKQWVDKEMKICKNGSWGDMWTGLIYSSGTFYNDIPYAGVGSGASISYGSNVIIFSWGLQEGVYRHAELVFGPIDLTGFKTLTVTGQVTNVGAEGTTMTAAVTNAQSGGSTLASGSLRLTGGGNSGSITVDLSNISIENELYISVGHGNSATLEGQAYISHIKLSR